jgi:hypothetical protein
MFPDNPTRDLVAEYLNDIASNIRDQLKTLRV